MRSLWSQSGISIIQGMVVSAVLAGSALIATRMITTQKMAVKSSETKDHIMELHRMIFAELQNREHCLMTFLPMMGGAGSLTSGPASNVSLQATFTPQYIYAKSGATGQIRFQTSDGSTTNNVYMNGNVRIESMSMKTTSDLSQSQPLVINYRRLEGKKNASRTKVGFGGSSISKTIYIRLQRATGLLDRINGCYAVEKATDADSGTGNEDLNQQFCNNLGQGGSLYTWDATRNQCVLKDNICGLRQVFEGIDSTGTAICRSINDYLPYLVRPGTNPCSGTKTRVGIIRDPVTNKVSIECW